MGVAEDFLLYGIYVFVVFFVSIRLKYRLKSEKRIIDDFFSYTKKGRRRVALLIDSLPFFAVLQLFYPIAAVAMGTPAYVSFIAWFVITFLLFYGYAWSRDHVKRHRHNGIPVGYEYPHPIYIRAEPMGDPAIGRAVTAGSKGVYDLQVKSEPNPHVMVIGETGSGKSTLINTFLIRAYQRLNIPFLIIDWSGSYKQLGVNVWNVPSNLRINLFSLRGMSVERRAGVASELLQMGLGLTEMQTQKVREVLTELYRIDKEPSIQLLHDTLANAVARERYKETKLQLTYITNKLRQAFEIFGIEPVTFWDNYDKTCNVIELQGLTDMEKKLVTHVIMQRITEEFKAEHGIRLYVALDDAYQALLNYYGKETNITKIVREGRKYGFGLIISTQLLQDMPDAIAANTALKFIFSYHESSTLQKVYLILRMSELEKSIMHRMPVGSCLLFDQNAIQQGKPSPAYMEVDVTGRDEKEKLSSSIKRLEIGRISAVRKDYTTREGVLGGIDLPQVSVYRFIVAMHREKELSKAIGWLKGKGLITSNRTLYGGSGVEPIAERAKNDGYLDADNRLTNKALQVVNPSSLVVRQGERRGGEDHQAMMKRIIEIEQEKGNFAFTTSQSDSFDVGVIGTGRRRGTWNESKLRVYEVQTNAIRSEVDRCVEKAKAGKYELIFATNSGRVREEIEGIVGNAYKVLILKPYERL